MFFFFSFFFLLWTVIQISWSWLFSILLERRRTCGCTLQLPQKAKSSSWNASPLHFALFSSQTSNPNSRGEGNETIHKRQTRVPLPEFRSLSPGRSALRSKPQNNSRENTVRFSVNIIKVFSFLNLVSFFSRCMEYVLDYWDSPSPHCRLLRNATVWSIIFYVVKNLNTNYFSIFGAGWIIQFTPKATKM